MGLGSTGASYFSPSSFSDPSDHQECRRSPTPNGGPPPQSLMMPLQTPHQPPPPQQQHRLTGRKRCATPGVGVEGLGEPHLLGMEDSNDDVLQSLAAAPSSASRRRRYSGPEDIEDIEEMEDNDENDEEEDDISAHSRADDGAEAEDLHERLLLKRHRPHHHKLADDVEMAAADRGKNTDEENNDIAVPAAAVAVNEATGKPSKTGRDSFDADLFMKREKLH